MNHDAAPLITRIANIGALLLSLLLADPVSAAIFRPTGSMTTARESATATLLPDGRVLVAGGENGVLGVYASTELYDPITGSFSLGATMAVQRLDATATLLPNGRVLVAGGSTGSSPLSSAELYDPASDTFVPTGSLETARSGATATLLADGRALIAGGSGDSGALASAEIYDPGTGRFSAAGTLSTPRIGAVAAVLPSGKVLIAGGYSQPNVGLASAELYDPASHSFTPTGSMKAQRIYPTATLLPSGFPGRDNRVLIAGGTTDGLTYLSTAELYDPSTGTFALTLGGLRTPRAYAAATLLPTGGVLVVGGYNASSGYLNSAEIYDPARRVFYYPTLSTTDPSTMGAARSAATAILLPNGRVLVAGGSNGYALDSAEVFEEFDGSSVPDQGVVQSTGSMVQARDGATATLLPDGRVLIAGGRQDGAVVASAELYDPATGTFSATGSLSVARCLAKATLLTSGKVLIAGGTGSDSRELASAELFDPASGSFAPTGNMVTPRLNPTATLLSDGRVLLAGGSVTYTCISGAEIYDPASGSFAATGRLGVCRSRATATLLRDGHVLVVGGEDASGPLTGAELYDPVAGTFSATGSLSIPRSGATATLLRSGEVLVAAGSAAGPAEIYDPSSHQFHRTASNLSGRIDGTAVLGVNDRVYLLGGTDDPLYAKVIYRYVPDRQAFEFSTARLTSVRRHATSTRLLNGQILIAGGSDGSTSLATAEIFDDSLNRSGAHRAILDPPTPDPLVQPVALHLTGQGFEASTQQGSGAVIGTEASGGGTRGSATNFPLLQLERIDNEQQFFLSTDPQSLWSDGQLTTARLSDLPFGHYLATVFVNGVPSLARVVALAAADSTPPPTCTEDARTACLANHRFRTTVDWQTSASSGSGQVMMFGAERAESDESAFFWFFSPSNFEMGLKVLDGCAINQRFWIFISGLTNQAWTVHFQDSRTGAAMTYSNALGHLTSTTADTSAFSCN